MRRACDHCGGDGHQSPCDKLTAQEDKIDQMVSDIARMRDILEAWNSIKGFGKTMQYMATAVKVVGVITVAIAAVWYTIRTGQLPK